ncbi:MAG: InlB B-repeat-containing protein [Oscillospiraceae bacterium]|nr:InlB B-repeat-containing protein [Oscillospiraceae bacterium]
MKRRFITTLIITALLLTTLLAAQPVAVSAAAARPVAVEGRTLARDRTGDSSAWIEIARYGDYSLIIRQEPLTGSATWYNSALNNSYSSSIPRSEFNNWYNSRLSSSARLRSFVVANSAMSNWGTYGTDYIDGISLPMGSAAPTGNDVAFALSYCEAALYCSTEYLTRQGGGTATIERSSNAAYNNYMRLLPRYTGANQTPAYWLRTPGQSYMYAGCVAYSGGSGERTQGRVNQHTTIGYYGHYRPALWVGSGIFEDKGTVNVIHADRDSGAVLYSETHSVTAGPYGPYLPISITDYVYFGIPQGSAPISGTIAANQTINIIHHYVKIQPPVTLTYHPNGGVGGINSYAYPFGSTQTVFSQGYNRPGYVFDSWNSQPDGSGMRIVNGDRLTLNGNFTLYAQWVDDSNYQIVIYYPNGGSGSIEVDTTDSRGNITITNRGYTRNGYIFAGWNTMPDGSGVPYAVSQNVTLRSFLILYAQWIPIPVTYSVTYHPGGGIGGSTDDNLIPGSFYTVKSTTSAGVSFQGYEFMNWNSRPDNLGVRYDPGQTFVLTSDMTLYAIWRRRVD